MVSVFRVICALGLFLLAPVVGAGTGPALVSSASAQESAPIWVNTHSRVYHCPGSRYYGNTNAGEYMSEPTALAAGHRPAYGQSCGLASGTIAQVPSQPSNGEKPAPAGSDVRVWVNTRSGVYHCPGSHYYGNTKSGEFMREAEARVSGNRPAYGRTCGR